MKQQAKCNERWVGQTVWRTVRPTVGPFAYKELGIRRGVIIDIYEKAPQYTFKNGCQLHQVLYEADFTWQTGDVVVGDAMKPHQRYDNGVFDMGLITLFEIGILVRGGLIDRDQGCFTEPQPQDDGFKEHITLLKRVQENPDLPYISAGH